MTTDSPRKRSHASSFPLESFDPRFRDVYKTAAIMEEPLKVEFPTRKAAQDFQARIHNFRKRAKLAGDSDWPIMYKIRVSLRDEKWLWFIRQDSQWDDVLSRIVPSSPRRLTLKKDPLDDF